MLTRHERKERLGFGHLARIANRLEQSTGKRYSISRISQVINCEKTGERNAKIEQAVADELGLPVTEAFPTAAAASQVATTPSP